MGIKINIRTEEVQSKLVVKYWKSVAESGQIVQCTKHKIGISAGPSPLRSVAYQIFSSGKVGFSFNTSNLKF